MMLSILILTISGRKHLLKRLLHELSKQFHENRLEAFIDYEILIQSDNDKSIGEKRNNLLQRARGEYIAFINELIYVGLIIY